MTEALIKEYYTGCVRKEWKRLARNPYNRLEFDTTCHFLTRYLPPSGLLLDAGGGPGRYTVELAKQGYAMVLLDMTPANLDFARRRIKKAGVQANVRDVTEGTIADLSRFGDQTFDGVLCTGGPLSHVLGHADRHKAISELVRVAKPGAPIFVSVISRLSVLVIELILAQFEIELPHFKPLRDTGDYFGGSGFTACHFYLPEELQADFKEQPVEILEMAGLQGISSHHNKKFNQLAHDEKRLAIWMETHYLTCTHPSVVGLSEHILIICRTLKKEVSTQP